MMSFQRKAAPEMELFRTDQYYIFISGEHSLWWNRQSGEFQAKSAWDLASADDPECLGIFYGIIGKIELQSVVESRLMLIKETGTVGDLPGGKTVYKIKSVVFLPLGQAGDTLDLGLKPCRKHQDNRKTNITAGGIFDLHQKAAFAKTWGTIKSATNTIKNTTQQAAAIATAQVKLGKRRDSKDREKFERRILEELQRIFTETDSFYYSWDGDLTNSLQRQYDLKAENSTSLWKRVDDRYFWNKHMLQDIIALNSALADHWILPIIQGFVQIENCKVEIGFDPAHNEALEPKYEVFTLVLISRRSRFRAGTRYKRRGVDENGKCANYVETEQIVSYHHHQVSFVQVRGSVPVFWSQPGYKYRPPPRIDKGEAETQAAFEKHFEEEMQVYGPVCVINLVDQTGKERIIWDAYTNHMLKYNHENITYCTFDFHEYCRGMHFENVSVLIASLADVIREMNYCWTDKEGRICSQKGVFRVNCIDCLDRTNVVQTAIAKAVMEIQFSKLGLISPEGSIPSNVRNKFQLLWANNGDIISKQYAGTNALKGDYTRTGERKLSGMMKDGMNSANRYYLGHFVDSYRQAGMDLMQGQEVDEEDLENCSNELQTAANIAQALVPISPPMYTNNIALGLEMKFLNAVYHMSRYYLSRFKDAYRQATIDMMLGNPVSEDVFSQEKTTDEEDAAATAEHVKLVIEDCKKMLISNTEVILGAWGLIDADPVSGDPTETEMDTILILTRDSYYVAEYDDHVDRVTKYQRVLLDDIMQLEFGVPESTMSLFKQSNKNQIGRHCIRISYRVVGVEGYFHTFRSTNLRFFNNMAIGIKTDEEMIESLKAIIEAFVVAMEIAGIPAVPFRQGRLEKRKSKVLASGGLNLLGGSVYLDVCSIPHMTRNVSETQLLSLKTVGSKALSNVTQQFSKLNKLSHSFNAKKSKPPLSSVSKDQEALFVVGAPEGGSAHSISKPCSDDEEEMHVSYNFDQSQRSSLAHNVTQCEVKSTDLVLPSVGILMSTKVSHPRRMDDGNLCTIAPLIDNVSLSRVVQNVSIRGHVLTHSRTDLSLDVSSLAPLLTSQNSSLTPSPLRAGSTTPEITVENTSQPQQPAKHKQKLTPPNTLQLVRKFSHSSDEVDKRQGTSSTKHRSEEQSKQPSSNNAVKFDEGQRSSSVRDLSLNITSSQSENALRSFRSGFTNVITSPAAATKDLVLSPLSKFARGMQNLGANLDPRKLKPGSGIGRHVVTEQQLEDHRRLQERWRNCRTRLIAL